MAEWNVYYQNNNEEEGEQEEGENFTGIFTLMFALSPVLIILSHHVVI